MYLICVGVGACGWNVVFSSAINVQVTFDMFNLSCLIWSVICSLCQSFPAVCWNIDLSWLIWTPRLTEWTGSQIINLRNEKKLLLNKVNMCMCPSIIVHLVFLCKWMCQSSRCAVWLTPRRLKHAFVHCKNHYCTITVVLFWSATQ